MTAFLGYPSTKILDSLRKRFYIETILYFEDGTFAKYQMENELTDGKLTQDWINDHVKYQYLTGIEIGTGVTSIDESAFQSKYLTSIAIPNNVTSIGKYAFALCSIKSITMPNSITRIEEMTFESSGLTSIVFPTNLTYIGPRAFAFCSDLNSISIPESVTEIGNYAFDDCDNLTIYVPDNRVKQLVLDSGFTGKIYVGTSDDESTPDKA